MIKCAYNKTNTNLVFEIDRVDRVAVGNAGVKEVYVGTLTDTSTNPDTVTANYQVQVSGFEMDWTEVPTNTYSDPYVLPPATSDTLGGVKIGGNVSVNDDGTISVAAAYTLPEASDETLGGVKVGSGLSITDGVLSATGGGGGSSMPINDYEIWEDQNTQRHKGYVIANLTPGWHMVRRTRDDVASIEPVFFKLDDSHTYITDNSGANLGNAIWFQGDFYLYVEDNYSSISGSGGICARVYTVPITAGETYQVSRGAYTMDLLKIESMPGTMAGLAFGTGNSPYNDVYINKQATANAKGIVYGSTVIDMANISNFLSYKSSPVTIDYTDNAYSSVKSGIDAAIPGLSLGNYNITVMCFDEDNSNDYEFIPHRVVYYDDLNNAIGMSLCFTFENTNGDIIYRRIEIIFGTTHTLTITDWKLHSGNAS